MHAHARLSQSTAGGMWIVQARGSHAGFIGAFRLSINADGISAPAKSVSTTLSRKHPQILSTLPRS